MEERRKSVDGVMVGTDHVEVIGDDREICLLANRRIGVYRCLTHPVTSYTHCNLKTTNDSTG